MPKETTNIILLSSTARSGSSFLGELMTTNPFTFYFFEPRTTMKVTDRTEDNFKRSVQTLFSCDFSALNFTAPKNIYNVLRHPSNSVCRIRGKCPLPTTEDMEHLCKSSKVRVMKTILIPVQWITSLVEDPTQNVKVIHLVRDPRASILSANNLHFNIDASSVCDKISKVSQINPFSNILLVTGKLFM